MIHQINKLMIMIDTNDTVAILCAIGIVFVGIVLPTLFSKRKKREIFDENFFDKEEWYD